MRRFQPKAPPLTGAIVGALLALYGPSAWPQSLPANALPTNGQVVSGSGGIAQSGNVLTVQQASQRLITHWDTFNIGSGAKVQFVQPGASAVALNRVLSGDPSRIYGQLQANGQVFLVNPGGVLFGAGARVDVGGIVSSTLGISDADFLAGRYRFTGNSAAEIVNEGSIQVAPGGYAALLGARVRNEGTISAPGGSIALAAAPTVTLDLHGDGLLSVQLEGETAQALAANAGSLSAQGGLVLLAARGNDPMATVVNNTGTIEATSMTSRNGVVRLEGGDAGIVRTSGLIDVSGRGAGQTGGTVKLLGDKVGLFDGARIDASGDQGGGTVLVGGNWQGGGSEQRANATYVGEQARIEADALRAGNGGKVVVWADGSTRFEGTISARGGSQVGNGGNVEVSGKEFLDFVGFADLRALNGAAGMLLLDPTNITISTGTNAASQSGGVFTGTGTSSILNVNTLLAQLAAGNVTVSTASAGGGAGDITVATAINYTQAADRSLTLSATRDILVNGDIKATGSGKMDIALTANTGGAGGRVVLGNNDATQEVIASNGGNISISGAGRSGTGNGNGILMQGARVQAGAGSVTMTATGAGASAMSMQNAGVVNEILTTTGNITINATASGTSGGVNITSGTNTIASQGGVITITGTGGGTANGVNISSSGTNTISNTTGDITINGINAGGTGINISPSSGSLNIRTTGGGNITFNGTSVAMGGGGSGVAIQSAGKVRVQGGAIELAAGTQVQAGSIDVAGTGRLRLAGAQLTATAGDIVMSGVGSGSTAAVGLTAGTQVRTTSGTGSITITGQSASSSGFTMGSGTNTIQADGTGSIIIDGQSTSTGSGFGISIGSGGTNTIRSAAGTVRITGRSTGTSSGFSLGSGTNTVRSDSGSVEILGTAGGEGSSGVSMITGTNLIQAGGNLTVVGAATAAGDGNGVTMGSSGNSTLRVGDGLLSVQGTTVGSGSAVSLASGTNTIEATGTGSIVLTGVAERANGVSLASSGTNTVRTTSGSITLDGMGGGTSGDGVTIGGTGTVLVQTGSGAIDIRGQATGTASGFLVDTAGTADIQTATGAISITGSTAGPAATAIALLPEGGQLRIRAAGAGDIAFVGDSFEAGPVGSGSVAISSGGGVLDVRQLTRGVTIGAGEGAVGTLNWSPAEIAMVDGFRLVRIGNRESGALDLRPPWFPFPVERPPASRTDQQVVLGGLQTVVQDMMEAATDAGALAMNPPANGRMRLVLEGFDDDDKKQQPRRRQRP